MSAERLGLVCDNPAELQERLMVSELKVVWSRCRDTLPRTPWRKIIVSGAPRQASDEEIDNFIAGPNTPDKITLLRLPESIGHLAMRQMNELDIHDPWIAWQWKYNSHGMLPYNYDFIGDGTTLCGSTVDVRMDRTDRGDTEGLRNATVTHTGETAGDHIDLWSDPGIRYVIINMGPDDRYHRIAPGFCLDDMPEDIPRQLALNNHLRRLQESGEQLLSYWIKLRRPYTDVDGNTWVEAIGNTPVARYLHDGALLDVRRRSLAIAISVPPVPEPNRGGLNNWPSAV